MMKLQNEAEIVVTWDELNMLPDVGCWCGLNPESIAYNLERNYIIKATEEQLSQLLYHVQEPNIREKLQEAGKNIFRWGDT